MCKGGLIEFAAVCVGGSGGGATAPLQPHRRRRHCPRRAERDAHAAYRNRRQCSRNERRRQYFRSRSLHASRVTRLVPRTGYQLSSVAPRYHSGQQAEPKAVGCRHAFKPHSPTPQSYGTSGRRLERRPEIRFNDFAFINSRPRTFLSPFPQPTP